MWNNRVSLTVLVSLIGLVLVCALLGAAYAPYYNSRRDARLTQIALSYLDATATVTAAVAQTQIAFQPTQTAVAGSTQTEAARPTITPTPTSTPTPTFTPTPTQPAAVVGCPASVAGTGRLMYSVPGGGRLKNAVLLSSGTGVTLVGRLKDNGWYQVKTDFEPGWLDAQRCAVVAANRLPAEYL